MASKTLLRPMGIALSALRNSSTTSGNLVDVSINDKTGIATVTMQRQPVNGLNYELLTELKNAFEGLGTKKIKGAILTSVCRDK